VTELVAIMKVITGFEAVLMMSLTYLDIDFPLPKSKLLLLSTILSPKLLLLVSTMNLLVKQLTHLSPSRTAMRSTTHC
jgi:hypothetical protein